MAEKEGKPIIAKQKPVKEKPEKPKSTADLLLENFVSLQRIMADLAIKISRLNNQTSRLLELFEDAAKSYKESKKTGASHSEERPSIARSSDELTSKIDRLIEQNKTIARGVSLIGHAALTREVSEQRKNAEEGEEETKAKPLPEFKF